MFDSPVLDLVILLSFTYFIGSLILSAINEALSGTLRLRQVDLKKGIYNFFLSPAWRQFVTNRFYESPNIQTLMRKKGRLPAYIPAKNFVLAIVEQLDGNFYKNGVITPLTKDNLPDGASILPHDMVVVLQTISKQVASVPIEQFTVEFEKRLEEFYNLTMDRVTGWYKRRVRRLLIALGFVLSVALNIDTIKVVNDAMADKGKLSKAVDNIAANLPANEKLNISAIIVNDSLGTIRIEQATDSINGLVLTYKKTTGYELGYKNWDDFKEQWSKDFLKKLLGVLLTAFALQLGSNYWFDLMNRAVNVRATGRKPDELRPDSKKTKS